MATIDSYSETNVGYYYGLSAGGQIHLSQSFEGHGATISSVKFYVYKEGTPPGNIIVSLYAHSGTFGTSSVPTGAALASVTVSADSINTSPAQLVEFTFSSPYVMTAQYYVVAIEYNNGDVSNRVRVGADLTGAHAGNLAAASAGWTPGPDYDAAFYALGTLPANTGNMFMVL